MAFRRNGWDVYDLAATYDADDLVEPVYGELQPGEPRAGLSILTFHDVAGVVRVMVQRECCMLDSILVDMDWLNFWRERLRDVLLLERGVVWNRLHEEMRWRLLRRRGEVVSRSWGALVPPVLFPSPVGSLARCTSPGLSMEGAVPELVRCLPRRRRDVLGVSIARRSSVERCEEDVMVRVARTSLLAVGGVLAFDCTEEEAKVAVAEWKRGPDGCDACEARNLEVASRVMASL